MNNKKDLLVNRFALLLESITAGGLLIADR